MSIDLKISENDLMLIRQSPQFDSDWYASYYRDVGIAGFDPAEHYLWLGWRLKRRPSEKANFVIDAEAYLSANPDVAASKIHPVAHYVAFGIKERRYLGTDPYLNWVIAYDTISRDDIDRMRVAVARLSYKPLISIIIPTYDTPPGILRETIESVISQSYENWNICIADDNSKNLETKRVIREYISEDSRISAVFRTENGHISDCSNSAVSLAKGEWIALLDHDDIIPPHALFCIAKAINDKPDVMLIYSDEDKLGSDGKRLHAYFKTDFNLELFRSHNMFSHFGVYRADLLRQVGGFRSEYNGSQDYDLALRCIEKVRPDQIIHIPKVLYHWRVLEGSTALSLDEKPYAVIAGQKALDAHFKRMNIDAHSVITPFGYKTVYAIDGNPKVSILIPTRDHVNLLRVCIDSIIEKTDYNNYEIIIMDNGSIDPAAIAYLEKVGSLPNVKIIYDDMEFNYSALNNLAAKQASGQVLCLLNNDTEIIDSSWMREMLSVVLQPDVGAVGAKLFYTDGTIQHAGVVMGVGGVANHAHCHYPGDAGGYFSRLKIASQYSAVTAACLMVKKLDYDAVGGLNELDLAISYNDIDFCLRLNARHLRNVYVPYAHLYHHESASRGQDVSERFNREQQYMYDSWPKVIENDPGYNPNFSINDGSFSLSFPPRGEAWW